ncbi:MAG: 2-phospho-L-lactate transferase [Myxococcales bacterium]|nr:2-phospho-L-lactate transferase [Myxococcales bacterium]
MSVVYLSGGVGGARLLDGVVRALPPRRVTAVVNVGDDFDHLGLRVCPDLDTVLYTLGGLGDAARGWGLAGETFRALEMVKRYGGSDWFALGDGDLGTHLTRTQWLAEGLTLTEVMARFADALDVAARVLPMSDDRLRTRIETDQNGVLDFQDWLVRRRAQPAVRAVRLEGDPRPTPQVLAALEDAEVVLIGPSNPYVSIDPILSLPGVRERLERARVIAVSPIVGGRAVKGPLAEMIPRLAGRPASAAAVAAHYGGLLDGFVVERGDEGELPDGLEVRASATVMRTPRDRVQLAREALELAGVAT